MKRCNKNGKLDPKGQYVINKSGSIFYRPTNIDPRLEGYVNCPSS